ncbi:hypothetical protein LTR28_003802, partial [Elasticomyces elasticus]
MYVDPRDPMVGASISTSANPTLPSSSPTPSSMSSRITGEMTLQDGHQFAVQRVSNGMREEADNRRRVLSSFSLRILLYRRFLDLRAAVVERARTAEM